jgi:hypothetical protein
MTDELQLTISQVCRRFPGARGARHVTPSTVTRWILKGCPARDGSRVKLVATRCGSRWLVRPLDLDTFFATLAADPLTAVTPVRTCSEKQQQRNAERAGEELERIGA